MIWLDKTPQQIESQVATLSGTAGLIRGAKNYGLRVEEGAYAHIWAKLKPATPTPDLTQYQLRFRAQPFPLGLDASIIRTWAANHQWVVKPLRSVGAKQWLLASNQQPPNLLHFNSQPILAQQAQNKTKSEHVIAAGPRKLTPAATASTSSTSTTAQPDPWATYRELHGPMPP